MQTTKQTEKLSALTFADVLAEVKWVPFREEPRVVEFSKDPVRLHPQGCKCSKCCEW
jgi:hypothetical protein